MAEDVHQSVTVDLVRPRRIAGESEAGYVLRRAYENGVPPAWLLKGAPIGGRLSARRYCPLCLAEDGYWQCAWDGAGAYCATHRVWLVDRCGKCGSRLTLNGLKLNECRCGFDLRDMAAEFLNREVIALQALGSHAEILASWLGALAVAGLAGRPGKRLETRDLGVRRQHLTEGADVLAQWPARLHQLLDALRRPPCAPFRAQLFNEAFPGLRRMIQRLSEAQGRGLLLQAIDAYVRATWTTAIPILGRNVARCPSQRDVARRLGVGVERLIREAAQVKPDYTSNRDRRGRNRRIFLERELGQIAGGLQDRVTRKRTAQILAIGVQRVRSMEEAGLLQRCKGDLRRHQVLERFRELEEACPVVIAEDGMSLDAVMRYLVPLQMTTLFFQAMQQKEICRTTSVPTSCLGKLCLSRSSVETWRSKVRPAAVLTLREAARRLGVKEPVVSHLVHMRLLRTHQSAVAGRRCAAVHASDLQEFETTYVPLVEWARQAGVCPKRAPDWAREMGIVLVCGPSIDGSRQYIARRPTAHRPH